MWSSCLSGSVWLVFSLHCAELAGAVIVLGDRLTALRAAQRALAGWPGGLVRAGLLFSSCLGSPMVLGPLRTAQHVITSCEKCLSNVSTRKCFCFPWEIGTCFFCVDRDLCCCWASSLICCEGHQLRQLWRLEGSGLSKLYSPSSWISVSVIFSVTIFLILT